jgi:hypothetical protein
MRLFLAVLFFSAAFASTANAQAPSPSGAPSWEFGLGPHVVYRDSAAHLGGGLTLARRFDHLAIAFEGSGVRREGHNDWRLVGGPRAMLAASGRSSAFVHVLAGTFIRQSKASWAVLPGAGVDVAVGSGALRFQVDVPVERDLGRTATSVRGSVWVMF